METLSQKQAKEKELTDQWTERWSETHTILQEQKTLGLRKAGVQKLLFVLCIVFLYYYRSHMSEYIFSLYLCSFPLLIILIKR